MSNNGPIKKESRVLTWPGFVLRTQGPRSKYFMFS